MNRTIPFVVLSALIAFGGSSTTMAASKKAGDARNAYAATGGGKEATDPREDYLAKRKGGDQTWCDSDPQCNGWVQWVEGVRTGKLKNE
jgi:hypothetical protein